MRNNKYELPLEFGPVFAVPNSLVDKILESAEYDLIDFGILIYICRRALYGLKKAYLKDLSRIFQIPEDFVNEKLIKLIKNKLVLTESIILKNEKAENVKEVKYYINPELF